VSNSTTLAEERCNLASQEIEMILKSHGVTLTTCEKGDFHTENIYKHEDGSAKRANCNRFIENVSS